MGIVNVEGYGPLKLPDNMTQDQMTKAIHSGIESGQLKPNQPTPEPSTGVLPYRKSHADTLQAMMNISGKDLKRVGADVIAEPLQQAANLGVGIYKDLLTPGYQQYKKIQAMKQGKEYKEPKIDVYKALGTEDKPFYTPEGAFQMLSSFTPLGSEPGTKARAQAIKLVEKYAPELASNVKDHLVHAIVRSPMTADELEMQLQASGDSKAGLGNVIQNPMLKFLQENILSGIPFTGAQTTMQDVGREIMDRAQNLVEKHAQDVPLTGINDALLDDLVQAETKATTEKRRRYNSMDKIASDIDAKVDTSSFKNTLKNNINFIKNKSLLSTEPEYESLLNKMINKSQALKPNVIKGNIIDKEGNPLTKNIVDPDVSISEANILASELRKTGSKYSASTKPGDRFTGEVFKKLGKALKNDVRKSVLNSGHKPLIDEFNGAEKFYGDEFADFMNGNIRKFTNPEEGKGAKAEDLLTTFLKTGGNKDRVEQLNQFYKLLTPRGKGLAKYGYLANAYEGSENLKYVNPKSLVQLWKKLGDNQKKLLFPDASERSEMDQFVAFTNANKSSLDMMFNPKTGYIAKSALLMYALTHPMSVVPPIIKANIANRLLTNPSVRKSIVRSLQRVKRKKA